MKLANLKSVLSKTAIVALVAGAFALAAPQKADAAVFVRVGPPAPYSYHYGYYGRPGYYGGRVWVAPPPRAYVYGHPHYYYRRGW